MSALRKTMVYLGLADGDEDYRPEDAYPAPQRPAAEPAAQASGEDERPAQPAPAPGPRPMTAPQATATRAPEPRKSPEFSEKVTPINKRATAGREDLRRITTIHPRSYNDAKIIGESFRSGIPVIMNVTDMGESDAKRLVDFSAGLVFGMHGTIERVTNKVFLLSPSFVEVMTDEKKPGENEGGSLFGHS